MFTSFKILKVFKMSMLIPKLQRFCWFGQIGWFAKTSFSVLVNLPTVHSGGVREQKTNFGKFINIHIRDIFCIHFC